MKKLISKVIVRKVGSAVLENNLEKMINLITKNSEPQVLIVSAIGNTTKILEKIISDGQKVKHIHELQKIHRDFLERHLKDKKIKEKLKEKLNISFGKIIAKFGAEKSGLLNITIEDKAYIITRGEFIAAMIIEGVLKEKGFEAEFIKAEAVIKAFYGNPLCSLVDEKLTIEYIKRRIIGKDRLASRKILIIPGFTGSRKKDGRAVCLGKNSSDLTATVIAKGIKKFSEEVILEFIKNTKAWQSADQRMVLKPVNIPLVTIEEVSKALGWKQPILHPLAIKGLLEEGIKVKIIGINGEVTKIVKTRHNTKEVPIVAIAGRNIFSLFINNDYDPGEGYTERIDEILKRYGASISYEGGDPTSVVRTFTLSDREKIRNLKETLSKECFFQKIKLIEQAEIHIVGKGICHYPEIVCKFLKCLIKNNITVFHLQAGKESISFIIPKTWRKKAIKILHKIFFEK